MVRFLNVRRVIVSGNLTDSWDAKSPGPSNGRATGRTVRLANNRGSVAMVEELVNIYACARVVNLRRMQVYVTSHVMARMALKRLRDFTRVLG